MMPRPCRHGNHCTAPSFECSARPSARPQARVPLTMWSTPQRARGADLRRGLVGREVDDHQRLAVAAEAWLKQVCKLRVPAPRAAPLRLSIQRRCSQGCPSAILDRLSGAHNTTFRLFGAAQIPGCQRRCRRPRRDLYGTCGVFLASAVSTSPSALRLLLIACASFSRSPATHVHATRDAASVLAST